MNAAPRPENHDDSAFVREPSNDNTETYTSDVTLEELTHPGGPVEDIIDWTCSSSDEPSRPLALAATIPFVGACLGRCVASPTGLRTNFYNVALAPSGYGKDHARRAMKHLITAAGLHDLLGPSRFMSASGLRSALLCRPSILSLIDEFDGLLLQILDSRAGIHNQNIRNDLLEIFSSASTSLGSPAYAAGTNAVIHNPNLCIYGTGTPDAFWRAVSSANTTDGLLARFILFDLSEVPPPEEAVPTCDVDDVPEGLAEVCAWLGQSNKPTGNLVKFMNLGEVPRVAKKAVWDPATENLWRDFKRDCKQKARMATEKAAPILNRAAEHAQKLALVVDAAKDIQEPTLTEPTMEWAIRLAWHSTCRMITETRDRISDNQRESNFVRILGLIKTATQKDGGISEGRLANKTRNISARDRKEILEDLEKARLILPPRPQPAGEKGGRPTMHYQASLVHPAGL